MIKKVQMFTVVCDNCKVDAFEGQEITCWNNKEFTEDVAVESGFIKDGDKHYCPECAYYDDEDQLRIITDNDSNR